MRILVVEDHRDIAENIGDYLEPKGHEIDFAADGVTGLHLAVTNHYDVVVLDLMLPGLDGIALCRKLREEAKRDVPVLMLTARDQLDDKIEGFGAGADDYLVKPFALKELEIRLEALRRRSTSTVAARVLTVGDLQFDPDTQIVKRGGKRLDLNPSLRRLLAVLMTNTHRVVRRDELEQALWGEDRPDADVLRAHIYALRAIVDKPFERKLLHTVHGTGYRLTDEQGELIVRFGSLRSRITLAMLVLAAVGSSIFAASIYVAAERLEQSVLNRHVRYEYETLVQHARADPELAEVRSALLLGFVGSDNPRVPAQFRALEPGGYHAVPIGEKAYQVYVGEDAGKRFYVGYDITEWEALEQPVIYTLIAGVAFGMALAVLLGFWVSRQVIAPVTALSTRLTALDPRERSVRLAPDFEGEVSVIAEAFDRYMERLDGFVEREQLFTSAAAHELRTPLAVIQGATEVLAEQPSLPAAATRAIARLQRAVRDMREFIEALLFLSREESRDDAERARCELRRIVTQLADDYRALKNGKPVSIEVTGAAECWVDAPPALPTIVVSNLLRNALEHTPAGNIRIALDGRTLTIADTGEGISADAQSQLFTRGYTTKASGGMGLHLTKRICDRFGWRLTVASTEGKGTTASVEF